MTKVYHADLWGSREDKYRYLQTHDVTTVEWTEIYPQSPFYLFIPHDNYLQSEYDLGWAIGDIFKFQSMGITSGDDHYLYDFSIHELKLKINQAIQETQLIQSDKSLSKTTKWINKIIDKDWKTCLYRPFDNRAILYCPYVLARARTKLNQQFQNSNFGLVTIRRTRENINTQFWVTDIIADKSVISSADNANVFPLYVYDNAESQQESLFDPKMVNLNSDFIKAIEQKLGYVPTPEAIFYYIYAIFYSPTYREQYAEFLKIDFPRVPLTSDDDLFQELGKKGEELVNLHLMKSKKVNKLITKVGGEGDNEVTEVTYVSKQKRVQINKTRYFEGIEPEVWEFKIGGYQVLDKWLKDRKKAKRTLSFDEVLHYQKIVVALKETMELMAEIDRVIPQFPIH